MQRDAASPSRSRAVYTFLARSVAIGVLTAALLGTMFDGSHAFLFFLIALALLGSLYSPIAWRYWGHAALCGFLVWPFIASFVFRKDGLAFGWFLVIAACGGMVFAALAYCFSGAFRVSARGWLQGVRRSVREVLPESLESLADKGVPVRPTLTTRETPGGTEHTVTWTDFVMLRDADRKHSGVEGPAMMVILLGFGLILGGSYGGIGHTMTAIGILIALIMGIIWVFRFLHERPAYAARSVVFGPDGSIAISNPPSKDPNEKANGPPIILKDGLSRLVSIEYGKTGDWLPLSPEHIVTPGEWYDVFMLFGADSRIVVGRSCGMREHAHRIAGQLNELKAHLTSLKPRRPNPGRVID